MKSIKTKIVIAVLLCALMSIGICGGIAIYNSFVTSYEEFQAGNADVLRK